MANGHDEMISLLCEEGEGATLRLTCQDLLAKNQFVDVTLSCIDGQIQAHRLVLCSVSGYLYELFTANPSMTPCSHPMVILRDSKVAEVQLALQYVYGGRTRVLRSKLGPLLTAAKELGCESLERVVNRAIHSTPRTVQPQAPAIPKGVSHARTPVTSSSHMMETQPPPVSVPGVGGGGIKSLLSQITKVINVTAENQFADEVHKKRSRSPSPKSAREAIPPMPKLLRMTPSPAASPPTVSRPGTSNTTHLDPEALPPNLMKMSVKQELLTSVPQEQNEQYKLHIQHDKAESFVYTNENLDMMLFGDEDDISSEQEQGERSCDVQVKSEPIDETVEEKPSICPWCNGLFGSTVQLQRHIKTMHTNPASSKPYACPYCTHEFARSAHLKRHIRCIHTSEKPYKCEFCEKEFSRQDKMKIHISRHLQGTIPMNASSNNNDLVRTCYPPASMSQNSGGQVPIKILIPTNGQGPGACSMSGTGSNDSMVNVTQYQAASLSPSSFFNDRAAPSIMINAVPTKHPQPNRHTKRSLGTPSPVVN